MDKTKITLESLIYDLLGPNGKLISGSKSIYLYDNPKNLVVFNANLVIDGKKVWYGDIDVTLSCERLKTISSYANKKVYVLSEMDARFENENKPRVENAIVEVHKNTITLKSTDYFYIQDDVPYRIAEKEISDRAPSKIKREYKKNYEEIKIPKISDLAGNGKVSPVENLQKYFIDTFGKEKAKELYSGLFLSKEDYNQLEDLTEAYCKKKYPDLHPAKIKQSVSWHLFAEGPNRFDKTPTWTSKSVDCSFAYRLKK